VPFAGTGAILGKAMLDARLAAVSAPTPTPEAYTRMLAMTTAEANVILAHLVANGVASVVVTGTAAGGVVTGVGTIT